MTKKSSIIFAFLASFLFMLPSYDKMWAPYDEGNYLNTSMMVINGMVPYRDFFLIMYPPGHAYTLAALLKVFGMNLCVGRIYNIVLLSAVCAIVFYITRKIASLKSALISFIVCLSVMSSLGEPPIPRAIWPGVVWSLAATVFILEFIEKGNIAYLWIASFFLGVTAIFRHDIASLTFVAGLAGLLAYPIYLSQNAINPYESYMKSLFKILTLYLTFPLLFIGGLAVYLYKVNALGEAYRAIFVLPATFHKWAAIPFPKFCFDFSMIFHRGCLFIRNNKFYIPILVCAVSSVFFFFGLASERKLDSRLASLSVILVLGVLYLQQLVFRVDDNHLAAAFPPSAILFGAILDYRFNNKNNLLRFLKAAIVLYLSIFMVLFFYHTAERYVKDIYVKPFVKKDIEPVRFERGTVYIPDDVRDTFTKLESYIRTHTVKGEKIYIGHLQHNIPQMGWFDLLYFLTDRIPAVKYYVMIPGFQSRGDVQEGMIRSLKDNGTRLLLLRDCGEASPGPLDKYIREEYKLESIIDSYYIYGKK